MKMRAMAQALLYRALQYHDGLPERVLAPAWAGGVGKGLDGPFRPSFFQRKQGFPEKGSVAPCGQRGPVTGSGRVPGSMPLRTGESDRSSVKGMVWRGPRGGGSTPPPDRSSCSVNGTGAPASLAR